MTAYGPLSWPAHRARSKAKSEFVQAKHLAGLVRDNANGNRTCYESVQFSSVESNLVILRLVGTAPALKTAPRMPGVVTRSSPAGGFTTEILPCMYASGSGTAFIGTDPFLGPKDGCTTRHYFVSLANGPGAVSRQAEAEVALAPPSAHLPLAETFHR